MFVDLHAHSAGISRCCRAPAPDVVAAAKAVGLDGIVLTNHYTWRYLSDGDASAFARAYVAEYERVKTCGEAAGLRVLFGVEVSPRIFCEHVHLLLYGVSPEAVLATPALFDMTPAQLHTFAHEHDGILVQAHPWRKNLCNLIALADLDGMEANCHPLYKDGTHREMLFPLASKHQKIVTCGCDYHADTYRVASGVYLPDDIRTHTQLATYLRTARSIAMYIREPWQECGADFTYTY